MAAPKTAGLGSDSIRHQFLKSRETFVHGHSTSHLSGLYLSPCRFVEEASETAQAQADCQLPIGACTGPSLSLPLSDGSACSGSLSDASAISGSLSLASAISGASDFESLLGFVTGSIRTCQCQLTCPLSNAGPGTRA